MTFSEKLTGLRRKAGISQEQLADRLGIHLRIRQFDDAATRREK